MNETSVWKDYTLLTEWYDTKYSNFREIGDFLMFVYPVLLKCMRIYRNSNFQLFFRLLLDMKIIRILILCTRRSRSLELRTKVQLSIFAF